MVRIFGVLSLMSLLCMSACSDGPRDGQKDGGSGGGGGGGNNGGFQNPVEVNGNLKLGLKAPMRDYQVTNGMVVTHVYAVSPINGEKSLAAVDASGNFSLNIDKSSPWIIEFINTNAVGTNMIIATLRSSDLGLDTLAPMDNSSNTIALGDVGVNTNLVAEPGISGTNIAAIMGLSTAEAEYWGKQDDICLRYVNPDINGDGIVDFSQSANIGVDFHCRFNARISGNNAMLSNVRNQWLDTNNLVYNYASTGFNLFFPRSLYSTITSNDLPTLTLPDSSTVGGFYQLNYDASMWAPIADVTDFSTALPGKYNGTYQFKFNSVAGTPTFTFTQVRTSSVLFTTNFLALNIKINTDNTVNDYVTSIEYAWIVWNGASWRAAAANEVKVTAVNKSENGEAYAYLSLSLTNDNNRGFAVEFPASPTTGTITAASFQMKVQGDDQNTVQFGALNNPGLSYDDKRGMRFFIF